ncbi:MAG: Crp/Fnr family transcriptional regulator [Brevundimonas sp.]
MTPVRLVDARPLADELAEDRDDLEDLRIALRISAAMDESFLINQVVRLGRQSAVERLAHLLLELRYRQTLVDPDIDAAFRLPLTQDELADATGLSTVHVNRTLQQLRREGFLDLAQGEAVLRHTERLAAIAEWTPPQVSRWTGEALWKASMSPRVRNP